MRARILTLLAGVAVLGSFLLLRGFDPPQSPQPAPITVDYPSAHSLFPPDITAPTFLWRDSTAATNWRIEVTFSDGAPSLRLTSPGDRMTVGEIDDSYGGFVSPTLTPEQATARTWKPADDDWSAIKIHSVRLPASVTITGLTADGRSLSRGQVSIQTSADPVGAPILYRDVPLMPAVPDLQKGIIKPLPDSLLPLIRWRLRYVDETKPKTVMENLPTCANCHSVSRDGKTLGLDVDGPNNNKALYGLLPLRKVSSISKEYVVKWSDYTENSPQRFGFMSQVSPDGKYVVTSVEVPGAASRHLGDRLYQGSYPDFGFVQVFYPTRGILAWYSRETGKLQPLPGADDPRYVQACAFWAPDGRYLIYSRADARDPYPPGQPASRYANDPNETQIQYDLYRIPFNEGKGGAPERIQGASQNGKSNNFPKVSPDGKWIVFVQNKSGLLMRPDSELYIVPFEGGTPRRLNANQKLMNSWHSFSPNGHWLVFSSKGRSPYTQLYLTHIDPDGNDSPAILIDNTTAANRAANIPEFVNIAKGGLERIDAPATEYYRRYNIAMGLMKQGRFAESIAEWRNALALDAGDASAHFNLAYALSEGGDSKGAAAEYARSAEINPSQPVVFANLALAVAQKGDLDRAIENYRKALALDPSSAMVEADLGWVLAEKGAARDGLDHLRKAVSLNPNLPEARNKLASVLAKTGKTEDAIAEFQQAVRLAPDSVEYRFNLAYLLGLQGRFADAVPQLEKAVELSGRKDWRCLDMLGSAYFRIGRKREAIEDTRAALDLAIAEGEKNAAEALRTKLTQYAQ